MGVSEVTARIAEAINRAGSPLTAREAYLTYVLQGMPLFRDVRRLDLWDMAYNQVSPQADPTETEKLIDAVYWLGADCLYGAYSESSTRTYYFGTLVPLLESAGIKVAELPDLSGW